MTYATLCESIALPYGWRWVGPDTFNSRSKAHDRVSRLVLKHYAVAFSDASRIIAGFATAAAQSLIIGKKHVDGDPGPVFIELHPEHELSGSMEWSGTRAILTPHGTVRDRIGPREWLTLVGLAQDIRRLSFD